MKTKRFLAVLLAVTMIVSMASFGLAAETEEPLQYEYPDGTIVEYYLDEYLNPYNIFDGEKLYLAIPLPHMLITDEDLLEAINQDLPEDPRQLENTQGISPFAVPTNYYDLTPTIDSWNSIAYSQSVTFTGEEIFTTPIFKMNRSHNKIVFKTSPISAPLFSKKRIHLIFTYYDIYSDSWTSVGYMFVDCSIGYDILHSPSINQYVKFTFNQCDDINSLTYKVQTSTNS